MNPTLDNDLQRAIDDITKNTNSDPVFGDAVAAPEPAMPAPMPAPAPAPKPMSRPVSRPAAPRPAMPAAPRMAAPKPAMPMPEPIAPAPLPPEPVMPMPAAVEPKTKDSNNDFESTTIIEKTEEKTMDNGPVLPNNNSNTGAEIPADMKSVKEAALRDLAPILKDVDMDSRKKFGLYKNIHDELGDNSVIAPAYEAAKEIADEKERADALLYLIDSIDNM